MEHGLAAKKRAQQFIDKYKMLIVMLVMIAAMSVASDAFLTKSNLVNIAKQVSINTIIACGMTFVIVSGGFDLSVGSIVGVSSVVSATLAVWNVPIVLALLGGMIAGAICGLLNGVSVAYLNIPPFIVTLATQSALRGVAYILTNGKPIIGLPEQFLVLGQGPVGIVPVLVFFMIGVVVICAVVMNYTKYGRHLYYTGGNKEAAKFSGIKVNRVITSVYAISGLLAGMAGVLLASRVNSGQPQAGLSYEMDALAAAVIGGASLDGGVGTIVGTLIGAIIIGVINNALNFLQVSSYWQQVARGAIIFGAVLLDIWTSKKRNSR